jgi:putative transcriptional regulator
MVTRSDEASSAMITYGVKLGVSMTVTKYFLTNYFLVAMPTLTDPYFNRSVVYICEHNEKGAVGIVVNQPLPPFKVNLSEILQVILGNKSQLPAPTDFPILCGGPIHPERGFVIHAPSEEKWQSSLKMNSEICVTTSKDILQAIAKRKGPKRFIFSLGYASWVAGQIEQEIINNFWLTVPANPKILFDVPFNERWLEAMNYLGADVNKLVYSGGHA